MIRTVVSLPEELHAAVRMLAAARSTSMNALVVQALAKLLAGDDAATDVDHFVEGWRQGRAGRGLWQIGPAKDQEDQEDDSDAY